MASNKKSPKWFIKVRGSYLPNSWQARSLYIPYLTYTIAVLVVAVKTKSSLFDIIAFVFPQWVAAAVVMTWIASKRS